MKKLYLVIFKMLVVLASSSFNRKHLFEKMGICFQVVSPSYEESICFKEPTHQQVTTFAREKARSVYPLYEQEKNVIIMGFDSMIDFEGRSLGKSKHEKEAFEMIQSFIGKPQSVITGVSIIGNTNGVLFEHTDLMSSSVQFRSDITKEQIHKYLAFGDWKGKCGAYSIMGMGIFFLEPFFGDFQNIVGVPVQKLDQMLRKTIGKSAFSVFIPRDSET